MRAKPADRGIADIALLIAILDNRQRHPVGATQRRPCGDDLSESPVPSQSKHRRTQQRNVGVLDSGDDHVVGRLGDVGNGVIVNAVCSLHH